MSRRCCMQKKPVEIHLSAAVLDIAAMLAAIFKNKFMSSESASKRCCMEKIPSKNGLPEFYQWCYHGTEHYCEFIVLGEDFLFHSSSYILLFLNSRLKSYKMKCSKSCKFMVRIMLYIHIQ